MQQQSILLQLMLQGSMNPASQVQVDLPTLLAMVEQGGGPAASMLPPPGVPPIQDGIMQQPPIPSIPPSMQGIVTGPGVTGINPGGPVMPPQMPPDVMGQMMPQFDPMAGGQPPMPGGIQPLGDRIMQQMSGPPPQHKAGRGRK